MRLASLDAPLLGLPVTVRAGTVVWEGTDLERAAAVFVERPVFPWPQPQQVLTAASGVVSSRAESGDREARSLVLSALLAASQSVRIVNPPSCCHIAASPAIALERLRARGFAVHPWRLAPTPENTGGLIVIDAAGRDRWHAPATPAPGDPSLVCEPPEGEVHTLLVAGDAVAGGVAHEAASAWAAGIAGATAHLAGIEVESDLACAAAKALDLDFCAVTLAITGVAPTILMIEAGVDFLAWDDALGGRLAPCIATHLVSIARNSTVRTSPGSPS